MKSLLDSFYLICYNKTTKKGKTSNGYALKTNYFTIAVLG